MFTFQQNKFTECQPCPVEVFKSLTQNQLTAETIDEHRRLKACGKLKEAREKKDSLPGCLYQAKEVLVSKGEAKYNKDQMGRWRLQSQCILNGLVMCDFDHVGNENLKVKSEEFRSEAFQTKAQELGILLAFITPGGDGLKVVFKADINFNLVDNQLTMAKKLGLEVTSISTRRNSLAMIILLMMRSMVNSTGKVSRTLLPNQRLRQLCQSPVWSSNWSRMRKACIVIMAYPIPNCWRNGGN